MYEDIRAWHVEKLLARTAQALAERGFTAVIKKTREDILAHVESLIPAGASAGIGGSVTVRELGIPEMLARKGCTVYDHWRPGLTPEEVFEIRRRQLTADFFLTGTNALTVDGRLVNIDGTGNRVAAMSFGPRHVIVVAGANKIVWDLDGALRRIKDLASPQNSRRLGLKTPCAAGRCCDYHAATTVLPDLLGHRIQTIDHGLYRHPHPGAARFLVFEERE
ncbi:MAG: lactate utilization protein [Bacillota bacterium]